MVRWTAAVGTGVMRTIRQGTVIDGRFRLDERIGSGGFSTVWLATDRETDGDADFDSEVVVKTPASDSVNEALAVEEAFERAAEFVDRFADAIQPSSFARQIAAGGTDCDPAYVVYEYVPGDSLDDGVAPGSSQARTVGLRLCHAIAYLHLNEYLYLDLKPENVHLLDGDRPVLIDFNTVVPRETGSSLVIEQDGYKPPEQTPAHNDPSRISARSDVFACGAVLYRLFTGDDPPTDRDRLPLDPRSSATNCPRELATVIEHAMEPDPDDRPENALDLLERLLGAIDAPGYPVGLFDPRTETHVPVSPSTRVGRAIDRGDRPDIWFAADEYVSPVQFQVVRGDAGDWRVADRSTNGTYVETGGTVEYLLSEHGRERNREHPSATVPTPPPPTETSVADGSVVRPIDENYHREFVIKRP